MILNKKNYQTSLEAQSLSSRNITNIVIEKQLRKIKICVKNNLVSPSKLEKRRRNKLIVFIKKKILPCDEDQHGRHEEQFS